MTAMMMTMPYLGCVVGFRRSPATLLRSTKVNGGGGDKSDGLMRSEVSRVESHFESTFAFNEFNPYDAAR
jgi:hypothetical protein